MAGRGLLETALSNALFGDHAYVGPTMAAQKAALPDVTPVQFKPGGRGRQPAVWDVQRNGEIAGSRIAYLAGLKASKTRKTTVTITTGVGMTHIKPIVDAGIAGRSLPVFVVSVKAEIKGEKETATITDHGSISVCVLNVGDLIASAVAKHGRLPRRTQGQGKGKGEAKPVAWGEKLQTSPAGNTYQYISIQCNLKEAGAVWHTVATLADLESFIAEHSEGFIIG